MRSRRGIVLATIGLLILLDAGRSLYARVGYARPLDVWQPAPSVYADLTWPPGADLPTTAPLGERVYMQRCAVCHGPTGQGNGPAAPSMIPRPRNFALGQFKYKSTPAGAPPSDADLLRTIREGLHAGAMPGWSDLLSDAEIRAVLARVKAFSPIFGEGPTPRAISIPQRISPTPESVARGRTLYQSRCAGCHGTDGRARTTLADAAGYPVVTRDLTAPWTFRRGGAPEEIWLRISTGLAPAPMPSNFRLSPQERWDVVNYVLSLARVAPWEPGGRLDGPGRQADLTKRGEYVVHAAMCGLCHTPINRTGIYRGDDFYLGGGMRVGAYPHGVLVSRNLTSDPSTGLGGWSEEQIVEAITNGRSPGRLLNVFDMPWTLLHRLQPDDARAIARYLKTALPPVRDRVPGPLRYGVIETIVVKIMRGLPAAVPDVLTFADGHFGYTAGGISRELPQTFLVGAQWLVLLAGVVGFLRATPKDDRPRGRRRRWRTMAGGLGVIVLGLIGWTLYSTPAIRLLPPQQLAAIAAPPPPAPRLSASASPEQAALAMRGRYLYTVTSCALCHGPSAAGGGKISWRPMGTLWTRNITPDPDTGIGRWSDAQIARAIRSGVAADGRPLHWQGMIWDHLSNLDEEDVRALVAYLRAMPPVVRRIPPARPPAADDCATYTFWLGPSREAGCR
jgi:mono/diheme cytochrome c family protein